MSTETLGLVPRDWVDMVGPLAHGPGKSLLWTVEV